MNLVKVYAGGVDPGTFKDGLSLTKTGVFLIKVSGLNLDLLGVFTLDLCNPIHDLEDHIVVTLCESLINEVVNQGFAVLLTQVLREEFKEVLYYLVAAEDGSGVSAGRCLGHFREYTTHTISLGQSVRQETGKSSSDQGSY